MVSTYTLLSVKSIITSASLTRQASKFFQTNYGHKLSWRQKLSLQNLWFYGVVFGNLLVVIGTIIKISIAFKIVLSINLEDITTIILGLAVFFQWCGLLRFLSYFDTYNVSSGKIYYVGYHSRYGVFKNGVHYSLQMVYRD